MDSKKIVLAVVLVAVVVGGGYLLTRDRASNSTDETDPRLRQSGLGTAGANGQQDRDAAARTIVALAETGARVGGQIASMANQGGKGGTSSNPSGSPYAPTGKTPTWAENVK